MSGKKRKHDNDFLNYCFTDIIANGEVVPQCTVTDLCIGQIGHGLGPRATPSYDDYDDDDSLLT